MMRRRVCRMCRQVDPIDGHAVRNRQIARQRTARRQQIISWSSSRPAQRAVIADARRRTERHPLIVVDRFCRLLSILRCAVFFGIALALTPSRITHYGSSSSHHVALVGQISPPGVSQSIVSDRSWRMACVVRRAAQADIRLHACRVAETGRLARRCACSEGISFALCSPQRG